MVSIDAQWSCGYENTGRFLDQLVFRLISAKTSGKRLLKTVFTYGAFVLHDKKTKYLLETIYSNKRKNKRLGIIDFD